MDHVNKRKKGKEAKVEIIIGTLSKHKKGFGFVIPETDTNGDIFIPHSGMKNAMNGDLVSVKLLPSWETERTREGVIQEIMKRSVTEVVGTFEKSKRFGFVVPDDKRINDDIFVMKKDFHGAEKGDKVVVKIERYPDKNYSAEGKIEEIISRNGEPGGDIKGLIRQYNLKKEFPAKVNSEAKKIPQEILEDEIIRRRDLRDQTIITMDGADAKDLDDAVSVKKLDNGNFLLGVHIADVSHYVKEGSQLDKEALKRGNSVYLIDQVIPMLPEALSNGICSLNPKVDRLTLSVDMEIDSKGKVVNHDIYESIIHSKARMVYGDVSDMLENDAADLKSKYEDIYEDILSMDKLAKILRKAREARGSLDFDFDEAYIKLNEEGIPISVETAERRVANRIIEEFMLIANETIAEHFFWMEIPFVYRIHESPSLEKIEVFKKFIQSFGLILKGNPENIHPKALNEILSSVEGKPEEHVVNTVMLRSMKKAFYGTECEGHFGLGVKYYCHFTSPIRRYPDLIIHRIIKEVLTSGLDVKRVKNYKKKTENAALTSSATERLAQELEREVEKMKKAEYMSYHVGEVHEGIISGVANFGFFVEIGNTIEGMVRVEYLNDDFYDYEASKYRLIGRRTNHIYALGDHVLIKVHSVDLQDKEINFTVADPKEIENPGV
ncbi:ribonuclease R [Clostridiales bacterium BAD-6]|uniref:Ribonuclease R n=2 Tax=Sinanaerobacter chloroacetimidivorans TaxID=2818044 RepID=A0A8J8B402_9FIRM|nr:ribonuclease R [Sinanaerobacter chloroacetimidivorans]